MLVCIIIIVVQTNMSVSKNVWSQLDAVVTTTPILLALLVIAMIQE